MKTLQLKTYLFGLGIILLASGCSTTIYEGSMTFPQNIMFDNANFKYVKTIKGSSHAVYNGWGLDRQRVPEGLINSAKAKMYKIHNFSPNQVITNISNDVVRTSSEKFLSARYEVRVVMSADVYEFSNNGVYSSEDITTDHIKLSNDYTKGFTKGDINIYDIDDEIIFVLGENIYRGTVIDKSTAQDMSVSVTKSSERINDVWVTIEQSLVRKIPKSYITYFKLNE